MNENKARSRLDQRRAPIYEALERFRQMRVVPFDVPGHKRGRGNPELTAFLGQQCVGVDVNSMKPLDNLCHPVSVIREAEELAADAFGAAHAFLMVGGTTSSVQSMVLTACKRGDEIILPRNVHRSVLNALVLCGAVPVYVNPEVDAEQILEEVAHNNADVVFATSVRMYNACLKVAAQHPKTRILNCSLNAPHPLVRTYYPRTYEVTYLLGMLAGIMTKTGHIGYVAANPVYGVPAAINAFAQGLKSVRPAGRIWLRWACQPDTAHPLDFADCPEIDMVYARDSREPADTNRDYGLCRKLPDGSLQPLGLPIWRWDTFYVQIVRSIFDGSWDNAATTRAVNYWWGLRSGAEDLEYQEALPSGTRQLLDLLETLQGSDNVHIFPEKLYDNEDNLHSPENRVYSPKELMEMDWLDACVHGKLPHYDELDVKTRTVLAINGLDNVKGLEK